MACKSISGSDLLQEPRPMILHDGKAVVTAAMFRHKQDSKLANRLIQPETMQRCNWWLRSRVCCDKRQWV